MESVLKSKSTLKQNTLAAREMITSYKLVRDESTLTEKEREEVIRTQFGPELAAVFREKCEQQVRVAEFVEALADTNLQGEVSDDINIETLEYILGVSKEITDESVRRLWAAIFSREALVPGAFSRRSLASLTQMDRKDVDLFQKLCAHLFMDKDKCFVPLPSIGGFNNENKELCSLNHDDHLQLVEAGLLFPSSSLVITPDFPGQSFIVNEACNVNNRYKMLRPQTPMVAATSTCSDLVHLVGVPIDPTFVSHLLRTGVLESLSVTS